MPANYNTLLDAKQVDLGFTYLVDDVDAGARTLEVEEETAGTAQYEAESSVALAAPVVPGVDLQTPNWEYRYQLDLTTYTKNALTVDADVLKKLLFEAVYANNLEFELVGNILYYNDPLLVNTYLPLALA